MIQRTLVAAAVLALLARPARADPTDASGRIESDEGQFEILGRPLRAGDRIELPEGYLVVEESGPDDGQVGSFGVVPAESLAHAAPADAGGGAAAADDVAPADGAPAPESAACGAERGAYLRQLFKESGIEVKDPTALLQGLRGGAAGPSTGFWWFALSTDAFRNLAWSSDLRSRADALARCVRANPPG